MSTWVPPKLDWLPTDTYSHEDLNRVEENTMVVADLVRQFTSIKLISFVTNRTVSSIEFADSLNRLEDNQKTLSARYTPEGFVSKTDWKPIDVFDYTDAARLENNLSLLYFYYLGNLSTQSYCGMRTCGEVVI